jgi:hypothetical protein
LEDRTLLSTYLVDHLADDTVGTGTSGSLRYRITNATDGDTITFGVTGTINLTGALPNLTHNIRIDGPGPDLLTVRRDTGGNYRIFTVSAGTIAISGLTITHGNPADYVGGGIWNGGSLTLSDCTVSDNQAAGGQYGLGGGGILNWGSLTVTHCTISGNVTGGDGGGIDNHNEATVNESMITDNDAGGSDGGGGIRNYGEMTVNSSTISGNFGGGGFDSLGEGGGILNLYVMTVSYSTVSGNHSSYGGGICNFGDWYGDADMTVSNSTVSGNIAEYGGGIDNFFGGSITVSYSTVSSNRAGLGDGILNTDSGTVTVRNSTVTGNSFYGCAAIFSDYYSTTEIRDCTVAGNNDLGIYVGSAIVNMHNTILAGNDDGDLDGQLASSRYNLIGNSQGGSGFDDTDLLNVNPLLGPLQDNGGPTMTMALLPGSPALNAGDPAQLGVPDQRGVVRTGGVNIGAYQASATAFLLTAPDSAHAGLPFDVTVTAVDPFGQVALGYTGTVTFSSSDGDPAVVLPSDYTFTADDAGMVVFPGGVTLVTEGDQTITATDTSDGAITGTATVTVISGNAPRLVWTVASGPATPGTVPAQPSNRQAAHETSEGQPGRSEASSAPVPLAMARHAQDVVFDGSDTVTDGLALNWNEAPSKVWGSAQGQGMDAPGLYRAGLRDTLREPTPVLVPRPPTLPASPALNNHGRVGPVLFWHRHMPSTRSQSFLDELAALVFVDGPGSAVRDKPVADGARVHGLFPCLSVQCSRRRRSSALAMPRRVLIVRTAPAVRPIRSASSSSGMVPSNRSSFTVHGRPPMCGGFGRKPNSFAVRRRRLVSVGRLIRAVWSRVEPSL